MTATPKMTTGDTPVVEGGYGQALANAVLNAVLAALFAALFVQADALPSSMWEPLGSGSFPRLVLAALVVFNVLILVQSVLSLRRHDPAGGPGMIAWCLQRRLAFATLAAFTLYALLMPWLGFPLASLLFLAGVQWTLGARRGKRLAIALVVSVVFSLGLYWLFGEVFRISLPAGRLW
ncbi:tripartite tricarboxylate transporter TctB family protein [Salinicola aestuarinus]|uniref:tripartite tricarboxylate transporter TctB family protein n=1 Tax=Salinicola aestuarinus TaxID=1949082 RepID=UPI000DA1D410|nr:tripartite tricarboxylate transporter TctB family protein [Salinicola aestuarinus]